VIEARKVDEPEYPTQPRGLPMAVSGPVIAMLLATLDNLILSTSIPTVLAELGGLDLLSWVVTAYALATAASTPVWGKLGDLYGRREVFLASLTVFMIGSFMAGIAGSMVELIAYRTVQGLGAGGLMVGAFSIIMDIMPPREGGKYQGAIASIMGVAMVGGPLAGGVVTDLLGWRWSFFINLPLGVLGVVLALTMLDVPRRRRGGRIDYLGATLLAVVIAALVLALSWAGQRYPWGSPVILWLGGFTVVMFITFLLVQRYVSEPVLPLRLFRDANFSIINVIAFLVGTVVFVVMTFVPLFQQTVLAVSPTQSGLLLLPMLTASSAVNVIGGRVIAKTGRYKILIITGGALLSVGTALLSQLGVGTTGVVAGAFTAIYGAGMGLLMSTTMIVMSQSVDRADLGVGSSTITLTRTVGGAVGLSIAGTMFAAQVERTMTERGAASAIGATSHLDVSSLSTLAQPVREAYRYAVVAGNHHVFILTAITGAALFGFAWFVEERPLRGREAPAAPGAGAAAGPGADTAGGRHAANSLHNGHGAPGPAVLTVSAGRTTSSAPHAGTDPRLVPRQYGRPGAPAPGRHRQTPRGRHRRSRTRVL
jgi:EmrB/QacA subfamily drug resistance transporter